MLIVRTVVWLAPPVADADIVTVLVPIGVPGSPPPPFLPEPPPPQEASPAETTKSMTRNGAPSRLRVRNIANANNPARNGEIPA